MSKYRTILLLFLVSLYLCSGCRTVGVADNKKSAGSQQEKLRGLYISNKYAVNLDAITRLVQTGKPLGVNMYVIDVHPYKILRPRMNKAVIDYLKEQKMYVVARVVCFQDGLDRLPVPDKYMTQLYTVIDAALKQGFHELQIDYIRFKDGGTPYSLQKKYEYIGNLIKDIKVMAAAHNTKLSADVFGRIVYNQNDPIGQKMEVFARHIDIIYPMLYPSHFTGDKFRMSHPEETIREGTNKALARLAGTSVAVVPYIQAFGYNVGWSRMRLPEYIKAQIIGAESTGARGWCVWNAKCDYAQLFTALTLVQNQKLTEQRAPEKKAP